MSYGKFKFESYQQFKTVQDLAVTNGYKTTEEFESFLESNYHHLKNKQ